MRPLLMLVLSGTLLSCSPTLSAGLSYQFASIAYSPKTGAVAYALSDRSHTVADKRALSRCGKSASDCEVAAWVKRGCIAVSAGKHGKYGYAYGPKLATVVPTSLRQCRATTSDCAVVKTLCTNFLHSSR